MDDSHIYLFQNAIIKEEAAYRMYIKLSEKTTSTALRDLFFRLAQEELVHKRIFGQTDLKKLKEINKDTFIDLSLMKDIEKISIKLDDMDQIKETIKFAISEEDKAYNDYSIIIRHLNFDKFRDILQEIAKQELRHKMILQKVLVSIDKKDWE